MTCRQGLRLVDGVTGPQGRGASALGRPITSLRMARFSPPRCRTKHLTLLRFEEPPCVKGKLSQFDPFFRIGMAAM